MLQSSLSNPTRICTAPKDIHPNCCLFVPGGWNVRDYISGAYFGLERNGELVYQRKNGTYGTAPADHPAIGKYGIAHDGVSTNLILYSDDFSQWWNLRDISLGDTIESPIGSFAQGIICSTDDTTHTLRTPYKDKFSCNEGDIFTYSFFVKSGKYSKIRFFNNFYDSNGDYVSNNGNVFELDIDTETIHKQQPNVIDYYIKDLGEFKRISVTFQIPDTTPDAAYFINYIQVMNDSWEVGFAGDGESNAFYFTRVQIEQKPYASSPIYTNGSTASRPTQAATSDGNGYRVPLDMLDPRVQACLGGKGAPLGDELVTDGNNEDAQWSLENGKTGNASQCQSNDLAYGGSYSNKVVCTNDNTNFYAGQADSTGVKVTFGKTYLVSGWVYLPSGQNITEVSLLGYDGSNYPETNGIATTDDWVYLELQYIPQSDFWVAFKGYNGYTDEYFYVDNISVKELQPEGTLICEWRPNIDYSTFVNEEKQVGIISCRDVSTGSLFYTNFYNPLNITDTVEFPYYDIDEYTKGDIWIVIVRWQAGGNFCIGRIKDGKAVFGPEKSFVGSFPIDNHLNLFYSNEYPQSISNIKLYDKALDDDTIVREARK